MATDPDTCDHDWKLDRSKEVIRLVCAKCGKVKDYADPPRKESFDDVVARFLSRPENQAQLRQIFNP